jgi:hypothetical protein
MMTLKSITLPVPNAIFFITGSDTKNIPEIKRGASIWSTPDCIAVGCTPDIDGETRITLGSLEELRFASEPAFDGELETSSRVVSVDVVPGKKVVEQRVPGASTKVRIWVNSLVAPNDITIGLG